MNVFAIMSCLVGSAWVCGPQVPCYLYYGIANRQDLVEGRIGIIEPNFPTSAKIVFYRHLTGLGLSPENQTQVLQYWARFWRYGKNPLPFTPSPGPEPIQLWLQARARVPGAGPNPTLNPFDMNDFTEYVNCGDDAFRSAATRLTQFLEQYGAGPEISEWLKGQDAVFCHCGPEKAENFPGPILGEWPNWLQKERQYQLAATAFYAGDLESAAVQFQAIAMDLDSPYASISGYLAARALYRQAQFAQRSESQDIAQLALTQIDTYLNNQPYLRADAEKLRIRILSRFFGQQAIAELGQKLNQSGSIENLDLVLWQYVNLFEGGYKPEQPDPLYTWLDRFSHGTPGDMEASAPHRLAQLYSLQPNDPRISSLLDWVDSLRPEDPAYATALAQAIFLNVKMGNLQLAGRHLVQLKQFSSSRPEDIPLANECANLALPLSEDWQSLFENLPRKVWASDGQSVLSQWVEWNFDQDALSLLNQYLPLSRWMEWVEDPKAPERLRNTVAEIGITRALLTENPEALGVFVQHLPKANPYKTICESLLVQSDPIEKRIQTLFFLLKNPGLTTQVRSTLFEWTDPAASDSIRGNWWPTQIQFFAGWRAPYAESKGLGLLQVPGIVSKSDQKQIQAELEKLQQCMPAPDYLTRSWLDLAQAYPNHPLIAEGLYLTIRATRYGDRGEQTSQWSRRAFTLLHKRYPDSEWAKKAKYWY